MMTEECKDVILNNMRTYIILTHIYITLSSV
jgi:hypothetical protein